MYQPLLSELSRFATGQSTASELERWLVSELQSILDSRDEEAIDLVNQVDSMLIEFGEGLATERDLLERVQAAVRMAETLRVQIAEVPRAMENAVTSNTSETITQQVLDRPVEDVRLKLSFA